RVSVRSSSSATQRAHHQSQRPRRAGRLVSVRLGLYLTGENRGGCPALSALIVAPGHLVNVAGGSVLNIAGSLVSLADGSSLSILNSLLLNVSGGSSASIGRSLIASPAPTT